MYLFKPCSAEPPHKLSHILRAKQLWPLIYPLYDPAFKHICHLNIHQSASLAWAWERGQCYQRADPIPESPQAPTWSLPTPWVTLPRTHTPELLVLHFWFVCFFPSPVCFPASQWRECLHEECRCMLCSFQPKDNPMSLELLVPGAGLAVSRLVPPGDTPGHLTWHQGTA